MSGILRSVGIAAMAAATMLGLATAPASARGRDYHFFGAPGITCEFNRPCEYKNYLPPLRRCCRAEIVHRFWDRADRTWVTVRVVACR